MLDRWGRKKRKQHSKIVLQIIYKLASNEVDALIKR